MELEISEFHHSDIVSSLESGFPKNPGQSRLKTLAPKGCRDYALSQIILILKVIARESR
jgi:hypothetical protein